MGDLSTDLVFVIDKMINIGWRHSDIFSFVKAVLKNRDEEETLENNEKELFDERR